MIIIKNIVIFPGEKKYNIKLRFDEKEVFYASEL